MAMSGTLSSLSCMGMSLSIFSKGSSWLLECQYLFLALNDWRKVLLLDPLTKMTFKKAVVEVCR